ncbi:MAG: hypothetical protein ABSH20_05215 [Tepidisphaeraceae bacterium]
MIDAQMTIDRFRRDLTISAIVRRGLIGAAAVCLVLELIPMPRMISGAVLMMVVVGIWVALSYRSARGTRLAAITPQLIASGNLPQAEQFIHDALSSFSLFRSVKLRSLHQLAVLRHAQERWGECAMLCRELLQQRMGPLTPLTRSTRLILASSLLEIGDVAGTYMPLTSLYAERLSLGEALELTSVQLDYLARLGQWSAMLSGLKQKLAMVELMSPARSAMSQAMLCLAAAKAGTPELMAWLKLRVEAIGEPGELIAKRPVLAEIWAEPALSPATAEQQGTASATAEPQ